MSRDVRIELQPIGVIHTDVPDDEVARRRRDMVSTIEVWPEFRDGLLGIDGYSHLFVLFALHRANAPTRLTAHPRGDTSRPPQGVFAARGRNHPNGLGLAVVELLGVDGGRLTVRKLDAFDGTPLIDLKPYDSYDVVAAPRVPDWWRSRTLTSRDDLR
ncbi:MAG: tRNA (N6-threonylcarbamoyladenosine(37)-N6)-methyltransferase TrmO [Proteobacteria bacterium]|nr:tRNA (N6-threonylcarbamoyladenosine(37)-N6)-methyltransferase TrmO [Pseudomonadota bacterium]